MSAIDLDAFRRTELAREPYEHIVVPGFLKSDSLPGIQRDFPSIERHGSYPASELDCGAAFEALLDELTGAEITAVFGEKFAIDLSDRPTMITVRGRCHRRDRGRHCIVC